MLVVWVLVWTLLCEGGEPMCYTNDANVTCRGFLRPAAANATLVLATFMRRFDRVAERMTRKFPHTAVSEFALPYGEYLDAVRFFQRNKGPSWLRSKYGPDVLLWWSPASAMNLKGDLMELGGLLQEIGLASVLNRRSLKGCTDDHGGVYCVPIDSVPWWVIYARSAFDKIDMLPPRTFNALIESCNKLRNVGIIPMLTPWKPTRLGHILWEILNMRTNGAIFHKNLTSGMAPFTDPRVFRTFENLQRMIDARCFADNPLNSTVSGDDVLALWRSNQVAMVFMRDQHRIDVLSTVHDEDDIDVMPFPTVTEGVVRGEIMPSYSLIVRKTTEQIRPASVFISEMLSRETFEAFTTSGTMHVSPRTDFDLPQSRWRERLDEMLRDTDVELLPFDQLAPPSFVWNFRRELGKWAVTSTNSETIPELLRSCEDIRQIYLKNRHPPVTITRSGANDGGVEVELHRSGSERQKRPASIILYSINEENLTERYTMPIKLWMPGEYIIRGKVVGLPLDDSVMVKAKFYVNGPPDDKRPWTVVICLQAIAGLCSIITAGYGARKICRVLAERRQRVLSERLADEQLVIDAHKSTKQLNFPMALICADRFLALRSLTPFETIPIADLILLHSVPQVVNFKLFRKILFLSHQWVGFSFPDPDSRQIGVMKNAVCRAVQMLGMDSHEVYVWIDYISIPQVSQKMQDMAIMSLVSYISLCDMFIIAAPECVHSDSKLPCNEATYKCRGWCRAELFAKILTTGFGNIYTARSDSDALETFGKDVDISSLNVFEGDFTCCSRKHACMLRCDRERLQTTFLGLYVHLLMFAKTGGSYINLDRQVCDEVISKTQTLFPRSSKISLKSNETTTVTCSLFGDRVALCDELVRLRPEVFSSSIVATMDRESSRALRWVPGTYRILAYMSVYATPELEEQEEASQPLCRGSIVRILAVHNARIDNTIVGQVYNPNGWIRLSSAEFDIRWTELIDEADDDDKESTLSI